MAIGRGSPSIRVGDAATRRQDAESKPAAANRTATPTTPLGLRATRLALKQNNTPEKAINLGGLFSQRQRAQSVNPRIQAWPHLELVHFGSGAQVMLPRAARALRGVQTLVLFDWDDTLCPSTWAKSVGYGSCEVELPSHRAMLAQVAAAAKAALQAAEGLGKVVIVTNAEDGWVDLSCRRWMPSLHPIVSKMDHVSARSTWESVALTQPVEWKTKEFNHIITTFYGDCQNKNVLSIGDSPHDRAALQRAMATHPNGRAKNVKVKIRPSPEELLGQLEFLACTLDMLCSHDGTLDVAINASQRRSL
jgi:hypothetical protein